MKTVRHEFAGAREAFQCALYAHCRGWGVRIGRDPGEPWRVAITR